MSNGNEQVINANAVNRIPGQQYLNQAYANMVGLSDLADDTLGYGSGLGGSIFGGGMYPMGNMGGYGYGMYGMGYGPGSERMNMSEIDAMRYDSKLRGYQVHDKVNQQKMMEGAEFDLNASKDVIASKVDTLQRIIKDNDQDGVKSAYDNLINAAEAELKEEGCTRETDPNNFDLKLKARASRLYYNKTNGRRLIDDLEENGDGNFLHGFKQGLGCGLGALITNEKSAEENVCEITGKPETMANKAVAWTGRIAAGALTLLVGRYIYRNSAGMLHSLNNTKMSARLGKMERNVAEAKRINNPKANDLEDALNSAKTRVADSEAKFQEKVSDKQARRTGRLASDMQSGSGLRQFFGLFR